MADLSLLLDVVLKTQSTAVRREFVRCGLLRQLQSTIGRNVSLQYHVVPPPPSGHPPALACLSMCSTQELKSYINIAVHILVIRGDQLTHFKFYV